MKRNRLIVAWLLIGLASLPAQPGRALAETTAKPVDHAGHGTAVSGKAGEQSGQVLSTSPAVGKSERKIVYYRNPMGLPDTSPTPKKDGMGMDYIPVYADELGDGSTVRISLDKVQKLGVRTEAATIRSLSRSIRAVGTVQVDERLLQIVSMKYEGWIEHLHADSTGQKIRRGQPLMEVYSPGLVLAQQEYLAATSTISALKGADPESLSTARQLAEGALLRLRNWDISADQVAQLRKKGKIRRTLTVQSPVDGVVLEKSAIKGMRFMPGEVLYRLADLSTVWLMADVFEQDVGMVREGQEASVTLNAIPGKSFKGKVSFIYPTLVAETRTVKVRIELPNPGGELRPALYATVELATPSGETQILTVPDSSVLNSGNRQVVLVERGEGLYEPRPVQIGSQGGGYVQIREGLGDGEKVVVRANFLIDAEANLKGALGHFSH
ncbi:MAG: efflux RND transporter periplasmic adaptor subunit [Magnetococcales bacterium]|nr:efflux RND transporter periplasmic adaptor subunit [Magnetococcales bacterium]MBF0115272.1 efflux RND transporter periplasmic adaptor subunit [Magnetococcales bacterium]